MTSNEDLDSDSKDRLAKAAEAFDQQLRELGNALGQSGPPNDRIRSVLELINATLRPGSTQSIGASDDALPAFVMPSRVGRFEVGPIVGQGGFGVVYRARDEVLHRDVALKAVPRRPSANVSSEDVRLREARAVARLNHPYIVPLYEVLDDEICVYLVSEFCEGPTLFEYLRDLGGPVEPSSAVEITLRIAQAISHAHDRGLVHRDIKPSNILLMTERVDGNTLPFTPRLTDFGLVVETGRELPVHLPQRLAGTVNFMAPEQILGDNRWDARLSDIYSLGLLLYRMLAGRSPYQAATPIGLLEEICAKPLTELPKLDTPYSSDLIAICYKAMQKEPDHRYGSARELVDDLQRWQEGREVSARKQSIFERSQRMIRREPVVSALLATVMLLALISAAVFAWSNHRLREQSETLEQAYELASSSEIHAINTAYRSDITRAFSAVARGDSAAALSIMDQVDEYVNDTQRQRFDMRLLRAMAKRGWLPIAKLTGAVEEVIHVPSLNGFAVASESGGIFFYRESDGRQIAHYQQKDPGKIKALAIAPDGRQMAVGRGMPRSIAWITTNDQQVVDLVSLDELNKVNAAPNQPLDFGLKATRTLTGFDATVDSLAYSDDSRYLAVGIRYEPIKVFDLKSNAVPIEFSSERRNEDLSFSSGHELTWAKSKSQIAIQEVANAKASTCLKTPDEYDLARTRRSRDGKWIIASRFETGEALLYQIDAPDGHERSPVILETTDGDVRSVSFSPKGLFAAVGTAGGGVARWDLTSVAKQLSAHEFSGSMPLRLKPEFFQGLHGSSVSSVAVSDQGAIMSGSSEGAVTLVTPKTLEQAVVTLSVPEQSVSAVVSDDGECAYVGCWNGSICRLDIASGKQDVIQEAGSSAVTSLALSKDNRWLAAGFNDGHAVLGDMKTPLVWLALPFKDQTENSPSYVTEIEFNSAMDGLYLNRGRCKCQWLQLDWSKSKGKAPRIIEKYFYHAPTSLETSVLLNDRHVMTFADTIYRFDMQSGLHHTLPGIHEVRSSCFAARSQDVFIGTHDGRIQAIDHDGRVVRVSEEWKPIESDPGESREISAIALSSEGQNILTGSNRGDIGIWDRETLRYLGAIAPANSQGPVTRIQLVEGGKKLIAYQRYESGMGEQGNGFLYVITCK